MAELTNLIAKTYNQRPSSILGINDDWVAFQLDAALAAKNQEDEMSKYRVLITAIYETMGHKMKFEQPNAKAVNLDEAVDYEKFIADELTRSGVIRE